VHLKELEKSIKTPMIKLYFIW